MRDKKFIITISVIILLNVAIAFGWFYLSSIISIKSIEIYKIREDISTNDKMVKDNQLAESLITELADKKEKIDSVFWDKKDATIGLINSMEDVAKIIGVSGEFGDLKLDTMDVKTGEIKSPTAVFKVEGNFSQVFRVLVLLENLPHSLDIEKTSLKKETDGNWVAEFNVSLLNFY